MGNPTTRRIITKPLPSESEDLIFGGWGGGVWAGTQTRPKIHKLQKIWLLVASFVRAAAQKSPQALKIKSWPNGSFRVPSAAQKNQIAKKIVLLVASFVRAAAHKSPQTLKI